MIHPRVHVLWLRRRDRLNRTLMRPHRIQEPYRKEFAKWVLAQTPFSPDEAELFDLDGEKRPVPYLLAKLGDDRMPITRPHVREALALPASATWADAVAEVRRLLPRPR